MEDVLWVPLDFHFYETLPHGGFVCCLYSGGLLLRHEIHVDPACGIGCGRIEECPGPRDTLLVLACCIPAAVHVQYEFGVPLRVCCLLRWNSGGLASN